jgi:hypothetical protein
VSVPYKGKEKFFDVSHRSLWDWATDLVAHPQMACHFRWDAERIYRSNGHRIFHEPWTADAFWNAQVCVHIIWLFENLLIYLPHHQSQIPESGSPLCFILYADKTKLSSFGTTKGYPVIARCANLPAAIRNGNGFGGGRVVGWLPIVMSLFVFLLSLSH